MSRLGVPGTPGWTFAQAATQAIPITSAAFDPLRVRDIPPMKDSSDGRVVEERVAPER